MRKIEIDLNTRQKGLLAINVLLIVLYIGLTILSKNALKGLYSQQEADRWEEKNNTYAQVSAFFSPERNVGKETISNIRSSIMETLSKDSLQESNGSGRVWIDAYSGECKTELRKDNNTLSVTAVGVGGEFFQFHPIPLLSGGYISEEDINDDRIVVDENFAWAMFGSNDIEGMQVWLGDYTYVIAGVVKVDENELYRTAYGSENRIYMSYNQLKKNEESLKITCYEAVLPNPISNYGYYALRTACGIEEEEQDTIKKTDNPMVFDDVEVKENSKRFEFAQLVTSMKTMHLQSMKTNSIEYPYWENVAVVKEQQQVLLLVFRMLLLVCPFICLVIWLYGLWKRRTWTVKGLVLQLFDTIREKQEEQAEEKRLELEALENGNQDEFEEVEDEDSLDSIDGLDELDYIEIVDDEVNREEMSEESDEQDKESVSAKDVEQSDENTELHSVTGDDVLLM